MQAQLEFLKTEKGWGVVEKIPSVRKAWISCATTQYISNFLLRDTCFQVTVVLNSLIIPIKNKHNPFI